ncbi:MAG: response regulator transcription factor [Saprospiraceae bacterium]|nr:response regulator transcription factor [Saprospiraceae bacterium]
MDNKPVRAVLIDDLPNALKMLEADLEICCPQVEIIGKAGSVVAGAKLLRQVTPDIVFLDIELEDGTGFDLLQILPEVNFKIIFVTASDQHAIRAFRFSAIDYLLKPIDLDELREAVQKATATDNREKVEVLLDHWTEKPESNRIALHSSDEIKVVDIDDIVRCESDNNYTTFYFTNKTKFLVTRTLKSFDQLLSEKGFYRVHQSHLINIAHVKSYIKTEGGYLLMSEGSHVPVAVRKKPEIIELLKNKF